MKRQSQDIIPRFTNESKIIISDQFVYARMQVGCDKSRYCDPVAAYWNFSSIYLGECKNAIFFNKKEIIVGSFRYVLKPTTKTNKSRFVYWFVSHLQGGICGSASLMNFDINADKMENYSGIIKIHHEANQRLVTEHLS